MISIYGAAQNVMSHLQSCEQLKITGRGTHPVNSYFQQSCQTSAPLILLMWYALDSPVIIYKNINKQ